MKIYLIPAIFFLFLFSSCTKEIGHVNRGNYPDKIDKIITSNCAVSGCHTSLSKAVAGNLNLQTWETLFEGSANGSPVIPFSSRFSSLCYYINTYDELGLQNKPTMPLNKSPLSLDQVITIKDWIDAGAPDKNGQVKWADKPNRKKVYAVNQGCDVVTVLDAETQLPMRFISVGKNNSTPHQVRVSPDGKFWYVIFINHNIMQKFRCDNDTWVADIPLTPLAAGTGTFNAQDWNTFVISSDNKHAYCVSWTASGCISKIDLENNKFLKIAPGQYFPHGICLSKNEEKIYVGAQTGNFITEIDTGFNNFNDLVLENGNKNFLSSLDPHDMVLSESGNEMLITCQKTNEVRVLNLGTSQVTKVISTGFYPQEIIYSPKFMNFYVSCMGNGTAAYTGSITAISSVDYSVVHLPCGAQPHGIAADDTKDLLYVVSRNVSSSGPPPHHSSQCNGRNGFVSFIDLRTFTLTNKKYELSVDPYFIFARP